MSLRETVVAWDRVVFSTPSVFHVESSKSDQTSVDAHVSDTFFLFPG